MGFGRSALLVNRAEIEMDAIWNCSSFVALAHTGGWVLTHLFTKECGRTPISRYLRARISASMTPAMISARSLRGKTLELLIREAELCPPLSPLPLPFLVLGIKRQLYNASGTMQQTGQ
jgi:hypothetical protein